MKFKAHAQRHTSPPVTFPPPTWSPGKPIPPRGSGVEPDAWQALRRHAEAHAAQPAPVPFRARTRRPAEVAADRKEAA